MTPVVLGVSSCLRLAEQSVHVEALILKVPQSPGLTFCTGTFKSLVESKRLAGLSDRLE